MFIFLSICKKNQTTRYNTYCIQYHKCKPTQTQWWLSTVRSCPKGAHWPTKVVTVSLRARGLWLVKYQIQFASYWHHICGLFANILHVDRYIVSHAEEPWLSLSYCAFLCNPFSLWCLCIFRSLPGTERRRKQVLVCVIMCICIFTNVYR